MVRTTQTGSISEQEDEQICPLCINELDETEKAWLPCSCGYQLCLFCYDRLKTEFSNRCPNCRVEYDSDFQAGLRRRQERVAQQQRQAAAKAVTVAAATDRTVGKHVQPPPPPPPPRMQRTPRSPRRDLHIEQEQLWPSLGATPQGQAQALSQHQLQQQHPQQSQPQQHVPAAQPQPPDALVQRQGGSPPQLAAILAQPTGATAATSVAEQEGSSSSSADTAATTPQSPVSSVVCFRAVPPQTVSKPVPMAVAAPLQGRCAVVLQRGGSLGVDSDPEGASLAASLQEAVRAGSLSVKQAAASLASYLRQRQLHHSASLGGSASSSPDHSSRQPSSAGSTSTGGFGVTPFSLPAGGFGAYPGSLLDRENSLVPSHSMRNVPTSASLSHWALSGSSSSLPMPTAQPGLVRTTPSATWQQPQPAPCVGSPVRDNGKIPLFMRRGSLPGTAAAAAAAAAAAQSVGSPDSAGGDSELGSGSSAASFPGFPSGANSPTAELKRMIAPPPGFGPTPLTSTGIAALPRFC